VASRPYGSRPRLPLLLVLLQRRGAKPLLAVLTASPSLVRWAYRRRAGRSCKPRTRAVDERGRGSAEAAVDVLLLFLVLFVAGIGVIVWLASRVWAVYRREAAMLPTARTSRLDKRLVGTTARMFATCRWAPPAGLLTT